MNMESGAFTSEPKEPITDAALDSLKSVAFPEKLPEGAVPTKEWVQQYVAAIDKLPASLRKVGEDVFRHMTGQHE
jgi:hypothetical protein